MPDYSDLIIGLLALFAATVPSYWLGGRLVDPFPQSYCQRCGDLGIRVPYLPIRTVPLGRLVGFAKTLPLTNVILISNWIPIGAALLMGIVMAQPALPLWRRFVVASVLGVLAWYTVLHVPIRDCRVLDHEVVFQDGLPLQMDNGSCSACSAAILAVPD